MRAYLLYDETGLWLAFGEDAVSAAEGLVKIIGGNQDTERFSVSGSWPVEAGTAINVGKFWPHFTNNPPAKYCR